MKVLIINGSPRGKNSNSLKLTNAFVEGMGDVEVREFSVASNPIAPCKGCFGCWVNTPGKCVTQDDMESVIRDEIWADVIIWSFPLYYFNVPGALKNLIDRQLSMLLPDLTDYEGNVGNGSHSSRYDMSGKKNVLISTCGFYTAEKNYDSITTMYDHMCGLNNYETIFCGQGELFKMAKAKPRTDQYLDHVKKAGSEFAQTGKISTETRVNLCELLLPKEVFEAGANAGWKAMQSKENK